MVTSTSHPTLEWSSLQDVFYRKSEIYHLTWGINNLSDYLITSAKNGGLVALVRDPSRLVSLGKAALLKPKIHLHQRRSIGGKHTMGSLREDRRLWIHVARAASSGAG
jgi:hypothetical protein